MLRIRPLGATRFGSERDRDRDRSGFRELVTVFGLQRTPMLDARTRGNVQRQPPPAALLTLDHAADAAIAPAHDGIPRELAHTSRDPFGGGALLRSLPSQKSTRRLFGFETPC